MNPQSPMRKARCKQLAKPSRLLVTQTIRESRSNSPGGINNSFMPSEFVCPRNPVLFKTPYRGPGKMATWQVEVASADQDDTVVWRSNLLTADEPVQVGAGDGIFVGPLANHSRLDAGRVYCFRVRQSSDTGQMSEFSPWHQAVRTADEPANPARSR